MTTIETILWFCAIPLVIFVLFLLTMALDPQALYRRLIGKPAIPL